ERPGGRLCARARRGRRRRYREAGNLGAANAVAYKSVSTSRHSDGRPERMETETGMSTKLLTGSFVALITPFNKDGSVDFGAFRTLLKFHAEHGTSAVLIMGSTGET